MENLPVRVSKRRQKRDQRTERFTRRLRRELPFLDNLPAAALRSYAQLAILSAETLEKLHERGLVRPDGSPDPFIETFRRLKLAELQYARQIGIGFGASHDTKPEIELESMREAETA